MSSSGSSIQLSVCLRDPPQLLGHLDSAACICTPVTLVTTGVSLSGSHTAVGGMGELCLLALYVHTVRVCAVHGSPDCSQAWTGAATHDIAMDLCRACSARGTGLPTCIHEPSWNSHADVYRVCMVTLSDPPCANPLK